MPLPRAQLFETLSIRARWTSDMIGSNFSAQLGLAEETISDMNLYEMEARHSDHVVTKKFNRKEEGSKSGADWLWCIGEPESWFCLLVQAKLISPKTDTCRYLDYKQGQQRARLLRYARDNNLIPRYCIYANVRQDEIPPLATTAVFSNYSPREWGCSILTPRHVRLLSNRKKNKREHIWPLSIPWSCIFSTDFADGTYELGQHALESMLAAERAINKTDFYPQAFSTGGDPPPGDDSAPDDSTIELRSRLPRVAQQIIDGRARIESPIAGVGIVSSVPIALLRHGRATTRAERRALSQGDRFDSSWNRDMHEDDPIATRRKKE